MYLNRKIDVELAKWKDEKNRKPLLIRGARQVGKSKTIREFGKKFKYYIELNFEERPLLKKLFDEDLSPDRICENLTAVFNTAIIPGKTLLFFDEIQSCPQAIASLRFFYEKMPELHLIAAGSLLEFALQELPTFGVGRIRSIFMYPLNFAEFLEGVGENNLKNALLNSSPLKPLNEVLHQKLLKLVQKFICIGGMPEVVVAYIETGDFNKCKMILDDIIISLKSDFAKYKKSSPVSRLNEVFQSVVFQTGQKFMLSKACLQANHQQVRDALHLLITAGIVIPVTHSAANGIPIGAETNPKKQKMLLFDTGIFQRIMNFDLASFFLSDNFDMINKGNIAELFVGLELQKSNPVYEDSSLYYWHREAKNSNAEVDYVIQCSNQIIPVEVKAGTKGAMQSLFLFLEEKKLDKGIRVSNENFALYESIFVFPLYAVENISKFFQMNY